MLRKMQYLVVILSFSLTANAAVWYVDKDNVSGKEDGTSWETAFTTIQAAIDAGHADGGGEVWVAEGIFYSGGVNTAMVSMKENVHIYGGFSGVETERGERDFSQFETIIDGKGMQRCVLGANSSTLDGFLIRDGISSFGGGGMLNFASSPMVNNCVFLSNSSRVHGGGIYNSGSSPTLTNCVFIDNSALDGGGMNNTSGSFPTLKECTFINNSASRIGGGMSNSSSSPTSMNCVFEGNSGESGGGMSNGNLSSPTLLNCTFTDNSTSEFGGGMFNDYLSSPTLTNCIFTGNSATDGGGGMYNDKSSPVLNNCIFTYNTAKKGGAMSNFIDGGTGHDSDFSPVLINCTLTNNSATLRHSNDTYYGGGIYNSGHSAPTLTNCILWGNHGSEYLYKYSVVTYSLIEGGYEGEGNIDANPFFVDAQGGDLRLRPYSPCVDAGTAQAIAEVDFLGAPRFQGAGVDLGAFELPYGANDSDGDLLADDYEGDEDSDGDGLSDSEDTDSDNDGVPDLVEGIGDMDGDGVPNYLDDDSDGDGIADWVEGAEDPDGDGRVNSQDLDSDGDGRSDLYEGVRDSDSDGIPEYLDLDSDGDGILDSDEPAVVYVDKDNATGVEDGLSWETAFTTLQPGIDSAYEAGGGEVWVAEGIYDEQRESIMEVFPEVFDDTGSLIMREEVHIFGGFAGNETVRAQRDWDAQSSVIDGSVARNGEAAYHAVLGADNATLDGFVITGGNANGQHGSSSVLGKGILNLETSPTLKNCTFVGDSDGLSKGEEVCNIRGGLIISGCVFVDTVGWAVTESLGWSTITDCKFVGNSSGSIQAFRSSITIEHCEFNGDTVTRSGHAISSSGGTVKVRDCTFTNNHFDGTTGAIHHFSGSVSVERCVFQGNSAGEAIIRGGHTQGSRGSTSLTNCVFSGNSAKYVVSAYGAHDNFSASYTFFLNVINCTFADNTASPVLYVNVAAADVINCIFWNDAAEEIEYAWGSSVIVGASHVQDWGDNPDLFTDPMFVDSENGDYRLAPGSPCIDTGTTLGYPGTLPETDILGTHRPLGDRHDKGAYEFIDFDINGDGVIDAADIQLVINAALGYDVSPVNGDINGDGRVDAVDVQLTTNAALGL